MNKYQERKERTREEVIETSIAISAYDYSYAQLCTIAERFEKLGKRYGLLTEFRENGII